MKFLFYVLKICILYQIQRIEYIIYCDKLENNVKFQKIDLLISLYVNIKTQTTYFLHQLSVQENPNMHTPSLAVEGPSQ